MSEKKSPVDVGAIAAALAAPFEPGKLKYKPQVVNGNRAIAVTYVDARLIQDRLDRVLGVENWQDHYQPLPGGAVLCRLRVKLGGLWITKMDVGSPSEQPDEGDRTKAAFSDALKRAAVKYGIGRYLYRLPVQWVDYDPKKRRIIQSPKLPDFARPSASNPTGANRTKPVRPAPAKPNIPANGKELHRRLRDYEGELSREGLCAVGELLAHVNQAGIKAGHSPNIDDWDGDAISLAVELTRSFRAGLSRNGERPQAA